MSRLEERYRRLLRLLPAWYRERREDEMVGTFMADREDDLDLEYGWPCWGESWAVAVLAVRSRLAAPGGPPRAVAVGDAVRLVALLGVVAHAAIAVAGLVRTWLFSLGDVPVSGGWAPTVAVAVAAVGTAVALVLDRRATARVLAVAGLGYAAFDLVGDVVEYSGAWTSVVTDLPLLVAVACLFAGFHGEAPAAGRGWRRALGGAVVVTVTWVVLVTTPTLDGWAAAGTEPPTFAWWQRLLTVVDPALLLPPLAVVVAAVVVAAVVVLRAARTSATWAIALAVAAAVLLPEQLLMLDRYASPDWAGMGREGVVVTAVGSAALALTALAMAATARRAVRRLPHATHPTLPA